MPVRLLFAAVAVVAWRAHATQGLRDINSASTQSGHNAAPAPALALALAVAPAPVVFWNSEGQVPNTTVLVLGAGLEGCGVTLCHDKAHTDCHAAQVLQTSQGSAHFMLPVAGATAARTPRGSGAGSYVGVSVGWFRACNGVTHACSDWRPLNSPDVWWMQGDESRSVDPVSSRGGWLKVFGRALGFGSGCVPGTYKNAAPATSGTSLVLTPAATATGTKHHRDSAGDVPRQKQLVLTPSAASCYDATYSVPHSTPAGRYKVAVSNGLTGGVGLLDHDGHEMVLTVVSTAAWPSMRISVAVGDSVADAVAKAAAVGGAVVQLAPGTYDMKNASLRLGHNVQLVGPATAVLRWSLPTSTPLIANANASAGSGTRYAVRNLTIDVAGATKSYVLDVAGHGVEISGVTVTMASIITGSASVLHTNGTGFSVTDNHMTHDQKTCMNPGAFVLLIDCRH